MALLCPGFSLNFGLDDCLAPVFFLSLFLANCLVSYLVPGAYSFVAWMVIQHRIFTKFCHVVLFRPETSKALKTIQIDRMIIQHSPFTYFLPGLLLSTVFPSASRKGCPWFLIQPRPISYFLPG